LRVSFFTWIKPPRRGVDGTALLHRTPETTPAISARHNSTFVNAPADGSANFMSSGGPTSK
jgi:hypothetical protein